MRLLVADSDRNRLRQTAHRLATLAGITVTDLCADLTQTFNAVEHRPPNLALVDPALARRPEFEMMEVLFRTLSVRWIPLAEGGATAGLDLQQDDAAVLAALRRGLQGGGLAAPRAGAGLLQSVDPAGTDRLILIGSSTGGVDALLRVLGSFPIDCPPTLIVQHTGAAYSAGLARLLDRQVTPGCARPRTARRWGSEQSCWRRGRNGTLSSTEPAACPAAWSRGPGSVATARRSTCCSSRPRRWRRG